MQDINVYYLQKCEVKEETIEDTTIAKHCEYFTYKD